MTDRATQLQIAASHFHATATVIVTTGVKVQQQCPQMRDASSTTASKKRLVGYRRE